jgi:uncharacterized protein YidB (DUF937 family)
MSSRSNLTALLAVLALAGYQNRDKIAETLRGLQNPDTSGASPTPNQGSQYQNQGQDQAQEQGGLGGLLGQLASGGLGGLGGLLAGGSAGGVLSGGLGGLLDQFRQNGLGDKADNWVKVGPNDDIKDDELSGALGDDVLDELVEKTGLSKQEILARLSRELPKAVDDLTPDGNIPSEQAFDASPSDGWSPVPKMPRSF